MPKLPKGSVDLPFFLYPSVEHARDGRDSGGTGFFVGVKSAVRENAFHLFAVTNWHVAVRGGNSVIRINRPGGGTEVFEHGPEEWFFIPGSHDVAILPMSYSVEHLDVVCISTATFATAEVIEQYEIGPGDDVFMPGRFVDIGGTESNTPVLRFGNIAAMAQPIAHSNGSNPKSYCIDMHSRSGYSGSPVFVYRTMGQNLESGSISTADTFLLLLGVHWGQFPESRAIRKRKSQVPTNQAAAGIEVNLDADEHFVEGLSGMTCVAPVEAILDLLELPKVREWIAREEQADPNSA